jgi:hypothetical protein
VMSNASIPAEHVWNTYPSVIRPKSSRPYDSVDCAGGTVREPGDAPVDFSQSRSQRDAELSNPPLAGAKAPCARRKEALD